MAVNRSKSIFHDLLQRIRGIVGGSLTSYGELFANTTAEATHKAMLDAQRLGATAIIRVSSDGRGACAT